MSLPEVTHLYMVSLWICFVSFWLSRLVIFKQKLEKGPLAKLVRILSLLVWNYSWLAIYLLNDGMSEFEAHRLKYATGLNLISLCLFWISASQIRRHEFNAVFSLDTPEFHISKGIYRWIRHPFYSSYLICYSGLILASPSFLTGLIVLPLIVVYVFAAASEEQNFLQSTLKQSYQNYRAQTGMFIPKLRRFF